MLARDTNEGIDLEKIVDRPFLFARFFDLPHGFEAVPIGRMTLQSDGTITGYDHPNERYWIPWENGFAIVARHRYGPPSSTWRQAYRGIAIGWFCEEPESPQKLCLIPQTILLPYNIIYVIASCKRYYFRHNAPVHALIRQLREDGVSSRQIKVVVNGCDASEAGLSTNGEVEVAFSTHNAWEWSALYESPLRWQFDYAMLLHDTSRIEPGFTNKVETFNRYLHWDYLPATPLARCLLGLYSHSFLSRLNPWLKGIDNITKSNGIIAEACGELLLRAHSALALGSQAEWADLADEFDTGLPRIRRLFPSINLHKFIHASGCPEHL